MPSQGIKQEPALKHPKLFFLSLLGFFALYAFLLRATHLDWVGIAAASLILSFLMTVFSFGLAYVCSLFRELALTAREDPSTFKDGARVSLFGEISSDRSSLKTPCGLECICYTWRIRRTQKEREDIVQSGTGAREMTHRFDIGKGNVMRPMFIRTKVGDVRVMGFPRFEDFESVTLKPGDSRSEWQMVFDYLQQFPLLRNRAPMESFVETESHRFLGGRDESMRTGVSASDAEGEIREEWFEGIVSDLNHADPTLYSLREDVYTEQNVSAGQSVCVEGIWSAEKSELGPGSDEIVMRQGTRGDVRSSIRSEIVKFTAVSLLAAFIANMSAWYFLRVYK